MPDHPDDLQNGVETSESSIPGNGEKTETPISLDLAGDLINLPFQAWNVVNPFISPLSDLEKTKLAEPFSRMLEKYGMGKLAKDEIVFGFYLTACVVTRIKVAKDHKKDATNHSREKGPGKDDLSQDTPNQ
jgi:hypothetical protein